ncbi:MAG: hypothetical protein ACJATT_003411 [Myxococcota bacterium]|jgi:hypothetical protein
MACYVGRFRYGSLTLGIVRSTDATGHGLLSIAKYVPKQVRTNDL